MFAASQAYYYTTLAIDESILAQRLRNGEEEAFVQIYRHYYSDLCVVAFRVVRDVDVAEEVVQETICYIWDRCDSLSIPDHLKNYLRKAVYHKAINHFKQDRSSIHIDVSSVDNILSTESYEETIIKDELTGEVMSVINQLPEKSKEILYKNRFDGMTYTQIAEEKNISVKTVEYHMSKTLRYLHDKLGKYLIFIIFFNII